MRPDDLTAMTGRIRRVKEELPPHAALALSEALCEALALELAGDRIGAMRWTFTASDRLAELERAAGLGRGSHPTR